MAKHINKGWSKPGDEIPQPVGVVLGGNLRGNSKPQLPPQDGSDNPPIGPISGEAFLNLLRSIKVPAILEDSDFQPTTSPAPDRPEPQTGQRESGKPTNSKDND